jgi:muramidase (phage lysozyme)
MEIGPITNFRPLPAAELDGFDPEIRAVMRTENSARAGKNPPNRRQASVRQGSDVVEVAGEPITEDADTTPEPDAERKVNFFA